MNSVGKIGAPTRPLPAETANVNIFAMTKTASSVKPKRRSVADDDIELLAPVEHGQPQGHADNTEHDAADDGQHDGRELQAAQQRTRRGHEDAQHQNHDRGQTTASASDSGSVLVTADPNARRFQAWDDSRPAG